LFDEAQYRAVVERLRTGCEELDHNAQKLCPEILLATLPAPARLLAKGLGLEAALRELCELAKKVVEKLKEALEGTMAPLFMWERSGDWRNVQVLASATADALDPAESPLRHTWHGVAADEYQSVSAEQSAAAAGLATVAGAVADGLADCAVAGLVFYAALVPIAAALLADLTAIIVEIASVVGAPLALPTSAAVVAALAGIAAAFAALQLALGGIVSKMNGVRAATTAKEFADGHWPAVERVPSGAKGDMWDATVSDRDADWSLRDLYSEPAPGNGPDGQPGTDTVQNPSKSGGDDPGGPGNTGTGSGTGGPTPDGGAVIRPGDTLWSIAGRHLGPGATDEQIAEEWPKWWGANRDVVGPDPNLILPGTTLRPPAGSAGPGASPQDAPDAGEPPVVV
jgi:hypothetical protein